jgi:peptidoglycan/LPS O-acetylase OafA/YrhL
MAEPIGAPTEGTAAHGPTHPRAGGLDVARALAAFGVLVTHVAFVTGIDNPVRWSSPLRQVLPRLDVGVSIFFVLSGLLICRPFIRAVAQGTDRPATPQFLWRRGLRIYPVYWAILAVTLLADRLPLPRPAELVTDVLLVHTYRPSTAIGPITQSWSLATEVAFYCFVPVFFWGLDRLLRSRGVVERAARFRVMAVGLVGWVVVATVFRLAVIAGTHTFDYHGNGVDVRGAILTWLPNHLDEFAVGAALALWLEWGRVPRITPWIRAGCYALAAAALWVAATRLGLDQVFTGFDGGQTMARSALFLICAAGVVGPSALAQAHPRVVSSAWSIGWRRWAGWAALISYGVYLWHQLVVTRWMHNRGYPNFQAPFPTSLIAVAVISVAAAMVTYWLVERSTLRLVAVRWKVQAGAKVKELGSAPALDGLRGLSILAVLGTHIAFLDEGRLSWALRGGFLGVDVFLVLSGFLIGATLLREVDRRGTVDFWRFLRRRARRLLPPLVGFFAVHAVVVALIGDRLREEALQAVLSLGFVSNYQLAAGHHPPFDLVHLWSLALEGQLYVLCGLAVWWARRWLDRTPLLLLGLSAVVGAVALWRAVELARGVDLIALYERTDVRADSMLIGLGAALVWRAGLATPASVRRAGALGGAFILGAWILAHDNARWLFIGGFTLISVAAAAAVLAALDEHSVMAAIGRVRPLRWLGRISYSLYLWHLPIYVWTTRALPDAPLAAKLVIAVPGSILAGWVSYRLFERWVVGAPRQDSGQRSRWSPREAYSR